MGAVTWAGGLAAALIALGTLARYLVRRTVRALVWVSALVRLPETVDRLAVTVDRLTVSVDHLAAVVDRPAVPEPLEL